MFSCLLVTKSKDQLMEQEKREQRGKPGPRSRRQSGSQMSLSDQETRAKATIKDIDELYSALQGLVPKPNQQRRLRGTASGTDTTGDFEESDGSQKTYSSSGAINNNRERKTGNLSRIEKILDIESQENNQVYPDDRMFASDTEFELSSPHANTRHRNIQRHTSLPAYNDESENEMIDDEAAPKKSRFLIFRRRHRHRRRGPKEFKKKTSSWRSLLSSLNFRRKSAGKLKKKSKNSPSATRKKAEQRNSSTPPERRREKITKKVSSTQEDGASAHDVSIMNGLHRQSSMKPKTPEPPVQDKFGSDDRFLEDIMKTRSDKVNKKLNVWYKHVVKETTSLNTLSPRYSRSCENLLTDSEIIRARRTYSSDTESAGTTDIRNRVNKIRVRKSRAKRNRRRERERWQSLPNVKLVSCALNAANKKSDRSKSTGNEDEKEKELTRTVAPKQEYNTTVKPVEAKLSFGNSLETEESRTPINDFMMIQKENSSRWLSRQCLKTTISCIRPLQLNLFYSESPSRETKFRSKSVSEKPQFQFNGSLDQSKPCLETTESLQSNAFKVRQTSSQRRRKRRSFKRQPRLPHQSPFYLPQNNAPVSPTKFRFNGISKENSTDESPPVKDSRLGSLDHDENVFRLEPINTSERRLPPKHYSESEDSGWASMDKTPASHANTAIQTEPVIIMSACPKVGTLRLSDLFNDSDGQSEA